MKSQLDRVLELLEMEDMDVSINNTRCTFPTAYYYPKTGKIVIHGNKPSMIRLALAYLVIHEKAHDTYLKVVGDDEMRDHHMDPVFKAILAEYEQKVDKITAKEFE